MHDSIVTTKVANGSVTTDKIADGAVTIDKIAEDAWVAIITTKLVDDSGTSAKILGGTIIAEDLGTGAVKEISIDNGAVTADKIADYSVTNDKLAPDAIPFASKVITTPASTISTDYENMPDTSRGITLDRKSHLLIMFSCTARNQDPSGRISVAALFGATEAHPGRVSLTPKDTMEYGSYTRIFFSEDVAAGTYTVKIE